MSTTHIVFAVLGSSGFTATAAILVPILARAVVERRRNRAEERRDNSEAGKNDAEADKAEAELTAVLTGGSIQLVEQYVKTNQSLRAELAEVKRDMGERITGLEHRLDQLLDVVQQEQRFVAAHGHADAPVLTKLHGLAI